MANEKIMLMAKANKLGVDGYRQMSEDELRAAIERAETGATKGKTTPAKGKTNGSAPKAKGKTAVETATGKTAKATPAKGKTTPAKGKASAPKTAPAKGKSTKTAKASPAKSTAQKSAPKGKAASGAQAKRTPARGRTKAPQGAVRIDNGAIDWKVESNVGRTGKRAEVLDALRKFKGDKAKVFNLLAPKAKTYYKGKTKHDAERTLVWLIGRVAFDYAYKTGQHTPGTRAGYGTSEAPQDVRRREAREAAAKEAAKAARAAKRAAAPAKGKGKR